MKNTSGTKSLDPMEHLGNKLKEQTRYTIESGERVTKKHRTGGAKEHTMITTTIAVLILVVALSTALALLDFSLRARSAYASLRRQSELVKAGFVPQVEASVVRLRQTAPRSAGAKRPFANRQPRPALEPVAA